MTDTVPDTAAEPEKARWIELFRDGRGFSSVLVILSALIQALQILVIAIIMPTVVADIGGAAYFTWPAMLYTIGGIIGAVCVGPVWNALGARLGYAVSGFVFLAGTVGCALAPGMDVLVIARTVQGLAGGLIIGGSMALVGSMFDARLRTRILALQQGTWTTSHLLGPVLGGLFAQLDWWRGSFWAMVPIVLVFMAITWLKVPPRLTAAAPAAHGIPFLRLGVLTAGVFCLALAGPVDSDAARVLLIVAAVVLLWLVFRIDGRRANRMFPSHALSPRHAVGLALWVLLLGGAVQNAVTLFLPLLLQVVHEVTPLFINFVTIVISFGWTVGAFTVSGWSGARERFALWFGPLMMVAGLGVITVVAEMPPLLPVLTAAAFVLGCGVGMHNVHLVARTLANAAPGEEHVTASSLPSIRSLGTAFGAAFAGMLANMAGLDDVSDPDVVGDAITLIYAVNILPLLVAAVFMIWFARLSTGASARPVGVSAGGA